MTQATLDLRAFNQENEAKWDALMGDNLDYETRWRKDEWMSYCWLLDHTVERMLGRRLENGRRPVRVLEVGFGVGRGLHRLIDYMKVPQEMVHGIELLPQHVEAAKERWPGARLELVGPTYEDVLEWFARERADRAWYDLIVARHVLQYNPEPARLLKAISGLLPMGRVFGMVVSDRVWNPGELKELSPMALGWTGDFRPKKQPKLRPLDEATMRRRMENFRWQPGWGPLLDEAHLNAKDVGQRSAAGQRGKKEYYALCERVR